MLVRHTSTYLVLRPWRMRPRVRIDGPQGLTRPMTRTPYPGREGCTCHSRVDPPLRKYLMLDSLLVPTAIVALAEIGDKTQLLALILAARFRKPWPIIAGIVAATLANHAAAGAVGAWFGRFFSDATLHWILAASFTATALWTLIRRLAATAFFILAIVAVYKAMQMSGWA